MSRVVLESPLNKWSHEDITKLIARIEKSNLSDIGITNKRRQYVLNRRALVIN